MKDLSDFRSDILAASGSIDHMIESRVVLQNVADKAGVHLTTAARAMKNDPRVRPETLARIQKIATELGYSPDPMLSALSAYRTRARPAAHHGTIAWVTNWRTRDGWICESFALYRRGAAETLGRQGYFLEDVWLREPGMRPARIAQILQARGIRGLLICPQPQYDARVAFPWERFSAVTFGYTLAEPALHRVTASHFQNTQTCLFRLQELGYRRPGLVTWDDISKRVAEQWTAAYRTPAVAGLSEIPILHLESRPEVFSEANRKIFLRWFEQHRPDAVLTVDRHLLDWLRESGVRVPEGAAYVSPALQESNTDHAGVLEPSFEIGRAAADFLVGMLNRGEYGIPQNPRRILLDGLWQTGATVRTDAHVTSAA